MRAAPVRVVGSGQVIVACEHETVTCGSEMCEPGSSAASGTGQGCGVGGDVTEHCSTLSPYTLYSV